MVLKYIDFYNISVYANDNWNGSFTPREIACYAYEIYDEYKRSLRLRRRTRTIETLFNNLIEDIRENAVYKNELDDVNYWITSLNAITK